LEARARRTMASWTAVQSDHAKFTDAQLMTSAHLSHGAHDRQYNQDDMNVTAGFEKDTRGANWFKKNTGSLGQVIGDGSGRAFGVTGTAQQGGYNGTEMDEALNNDMTGVTEAGYADKIATGIDRIKGDYSTLPKHMQELFTKLRAVAKSEGIDIERTFQDAGGTRFGTITKRLFKSALTIAFQHYAFSVKELDEIVEAYDCGLPDKYNGGFEEVAWRDFTNDVLSATVIAKEVAYDMTDTDATDAGYADGIMTGIDKIKGGFEDLPLHLQQTMIALRKMSKIEGINIEMVMQDAGGTRFGTIGKRQFKSALGIAFPRYTITAKVYDDLADFYGVGDDDPKDGWDVPEHDLSLRAMRVNGGKMQVAWRDFCNDMIVSVSFDHLGREVKTAANDGIAGRGNTTYVHAIPGAQNNPNAMRPQ